MTTSENELIREAARWARVVDYPLPGDYEGLYAPAKGLILLDAGLSPIQRRCVLAHEISHARHRDVGCRTDRWTERRADMEASALLIDPLEYAFAESVWGQNVQGIAVELGVMPWVVHAYRQRLHDDPSLAVL